MHLHEIKIGQFVQGIQPGEVAEIRFVETITDGIVKIHYKTLSGQRA